MLYLSLCHLSRGKCGTWHTVTGVEIFVEEMLNFCAPMLSEKTPCSMMAGTISSLPQHLVSIFQRIDNGCIFRAFLRWLGVIFQQLITCGHTSLHRYFCRIDLNDLPIIPHGTPGRFLNKKTVYVVCARGEGGGGKKDKFPLLPFGNLSTFFPGEDPGRLFSFRLGFWARFQESTEPAESCSFPLLFKAAFLFTEVVYILHGSIYLSLCDKLSQYRAP